ncbi:MAG: DUF721 domain-containing protein [Actinobacteria bacterium]|nr:DUF721 domain-containing protein [Actinomycetota bacterium]
MTDETNTGSDASAGDAANRALRRATSGGPRRAQSATRRPRLSGAHSDGRDPKRLTDAVDALLAEQGWATANAVAGLIARWPDVVGADLADHVTPESFTDGRLLLRADSTAWATQVRLLLPQLRIAIDRAVGTGLVADISVLGPQAPSWVAGPRRVMGRGPRDTYG